MSKPPSYLDEKSKLAKAWNQPLSCLLSNPPPEFTAAEAERHRIYALLCLALVYVYHNGNKAGARDRVYPRRENQRRDDGTYEGDKKDGDRYIGHNIAAIAVDATGHVMDFSFNHNKIFSSSTEHAEARLIRRLFQLNSVQDSWVVKTLPDKKTSTLDQVTVYTSLESCAQCAGIMALARVKQVFYAQPDPGQYMIGHLMRALDDGKTPTEHVPGYAIGLSQYEALMDGYATFKKEVANVPFWWENDEHPQQHQPKDCKTCDRKDDLTSFLCEDAARSIFKSAHDALASFVVLNPCHQEGKGVLLTNARADSTIEAPTILTNQEVLEHARHFLTYARALGQRGTPHQ
jgi:tRNA(Arg) A34 adenosine deaminase TadA